MKVKLVMPLLVVLLFVQQVLGQEKVVTGMVMDSENNPIVMGNVILLHPTDSTLVTGDIF